MDRDERQDEVREYKSPPHVVRLFLEKSRKTLRKKCRRLKVDNKRLTVQAHDATKSRDMWRTRFATQAKQSKDLEAEVAALKQEVASLKKGDPSRRQ
jgi:hypothetical protein